MNESAVRIVKLESTRVASAYAFGSSPEHDAWKKLMTWAQPKGLIDDPDSFRIFGFNNPNPSTGSPNYGYEFWIEVAEDMMPNGDVRIETFDGGLYAVKRCQGVEQIGAAWQKLVEWLTTSQYKHASHQWLEAHLSPVGTPENEMVLDLYAPIAD